MVCLMLPALATGWIARAEETAVGHNEVIHEFPPGTEPPELEIAYFDPLGMDPDSYWTHLGTNAPSLAFVAYPEALYLYERSSDLSSWTAWAGFNNLYDSGYFTVKAGIDVAGEREFYRVVKVVDGVSATVPPPQYETFQPPTAGEWFTDPLFNTPIKRLTDEQNIYGWNGERAMFSADDQYFVIAVNNPPKTLRLFDGRTGDMIRDLSLSLADTSIVRWCYDPQMLVYAEGNKLKSYNVITDLETILAEFPEPIGDSTGRLCGGDGNDFDDAGEWLLLNMGDRMFAYNVRTGETGPEKDTSGFDVDYFTMSPSGQYIVGNSTGGKFLWNRDWTNERQLLAKNRHMDMGYLNGTDECLVSRVDGGSFLAVRFSDGVQFEILRTDRWFSPMISAVGGSNRQHVYLAMRSHGLDPSVEWYRYFGELVQVPLVTGSAQVRRLAHHRCRVPEGGNSFANQPEAWINHAGDRLFFRSNMDNYTADGKHDLYMIEIAP
jgi:hypothetical protein